MPFTTPSLLERKSSSHLPCILLWACRYLCCYLKVSQRVGLSSLFIWKQMKGKGERGNDQSVLSASRHGFKKLIEMLHACRCHRWKEACRREEDWKSGWLGNFNRDHADFARLPSRATCSRGDATHLSRDAWCFLKDTMIKNHRCRSRWHTSQDCTSDIPTARKVVSQGYLVESLTRIVGSQRAPDHIYNINDGAARYRLYLGFSGRHNDRDR